MAASANFPFQGAKPPWKSQRLLQHLATRQGQLTTAMLGRDAEKMEELAAEIHAACRELAAAMRREGETAGTGGNAVPAGRPRQTAGSR